MKVHKIHLARSIFHILHLSSRHIFIPDIDQCHSVSRLLPFYFFQLHLLFSTARLHGHGSLPQGIHRLQKLLCHSEKKESASVEVVQHGRTVQDPGRADARTDLQIHQCPRQQKSTYKIFSVGRRQRRSACGRERRTYRPRWFRSSTKSSGDRREDLGSRISEQEILKKFRNQGLQRDGGGIFPRQPEIFSARWRIREDSF